MLTEQLQAALNSRIVIEQAKGVVSYTHRVPFDEAFTLIRAYARSHRCRSATWRPALVDLTLTLDPLEGVDADGDTSI